MLRFKQTRKGCICGLTDLQTLPWWHGGKEATYNAGDTSSVSGSGRSLGEGNRNPLQYSCLENPMDRSPRGHKSMEHMT